MRDISRICTGGARTEKAILPEEPSSSTLYLTLYELELIDSNALTPEERTTAVCQKISQMLNETPTNPLRVRDIARLVAGWDAWQKLVLLQEGMLQRLIDIVKLHSEPEQGREIAGNNNQEDSPRVKSPNHGVGYATGSTATQWNIKKVMDKRRRNEAVLIACLRALRAMVAKFDVDSVSPEQPDRLVFEAITIDKFHITSEMQRQFQRHDFAQFLGQLLSNQSILDVSEHVELFTAVMQLIATMSLFTQLNYFFIRPQASLDKCIAEYVSDFRANVTISYSQMNRNYAFDEDRFLIFVNRMESWYRILKTSLLYLQGYEIRSTDAEKPLTTFTESLGTLEAKYVQVMTAQQVTFHEFLTVDSELKVPYSYEKEAANLHPFSVGLAGRMSRITKEIAALKSSLPVNYDSAIFVAIDESRSDVIKVLITGPRDTPYEDGCFEMDVFFPKNYPASPPKVRLTTTGNGTVRFNPNLYNDGKICLSILNTWEGRPEERWNPTFSLLQVLVSIQALIFVPEPYFNEPGFEKVRGTPQAQNESDAYNARLKLATMQFAIITNIMAPPPYFEEVIRTHFWVKRQNIIRRAKEWARKLKLKEDHVQLEVDELSLEWMPLNRVMLEARIAELERRLNELLPPDSMDADLLM